MDLNKKRLVFIDKAKQLYGDRYDYSKVDYKGCNEKVHIICSRHSDFWQTPSQHLQTCGCTGCKTECKKPNKTTSVFIEDAIKVHGNKYDYSRVDYKGVNVEVDILCPIHGVFKQKPSCHLSGRGCPECGKRKISESLRSTTSKFIESACLIHGDKYDYSKVDYKNSSTKVCIICQLHGEFWMTPNRHLSHGGCPKCSSVKRLTTEEFIQRARETHGDKYDYSKVEYKNSYTKVCIICPIHGEFWQQPNTHLRTYGCPKCSSQRYKITPQEIVLQKFRETHGFKYDYSLVQYSGLSHKVSIICPKHGIFEQRPHDHILGRGCPICSESHGEREISKWLNKHNIEYLREYKIIPQQVLFGVNTFKVDFFLPLHNTIIEFNGKQHYIKQDCWQSEEQFQNQKDRDKRLKDYCKNNNIHLIVIPYTMEKNIEKILHAHKLDLQN